MTLRTLKDLDVLGKTVLCRVDLNVPMHHGKVEDATRIERLVPTLKALIARRAKVVVLSHFGRPDGEFKFDMTLAPLADALSVALGGKDVKFAVDCIGPVAKAAVADLGEGEVLLLENLRFHPGETANDPAFVDELAKLGDVYVNDTFSCSHRNHASIVGLPTRMPSAAGLLMEDEIENLERVLTNPEQPMAAIVGGSKVSTKLELLDCLIEKSQFLVIGGAMANTFLSAKGYGIGKSLHEKKLVKTAADIMKRAESKNCEIILPSYVVVAKELKEKAECQVVPVDAVPSDSMILDIGPVALARLTEKLASIRTLLWNGPMGAFEYRPFDVGTISLARSVAAYTQKGTLTSVAGGGDVVAALGCAGLANAFSYISTAGGAFLKWLEGEDLVGVEVLRGEIRVPHKKIV